MTLTNQDIYKPVRKTLDIKRNNAIAATGKKKNERDCEEFGLYETD
jgi:hypothetical protein